MSVNDDMAEQFVRSLENYKRQYRIDMQEAAEALHDTFPTPSELLAQRAARTTVKYEWDADQLVSAWSGGDNREDEMKITARRDGDEIVYTAGNEHVAIDGGGCVLRHAGSLLRHGQSLPDKLTDCGVLEQAPDGIRTWSEDGHHAAIARGDIEWVSAKRDEPQVTHSEEEYWEVLRDDATPGHVKRTVLRNLLELHGVQDMTILLNETPPRRRDNGRDLSADVRRLTSKPNPATGKAWKLAELAEALGVCMSTISRRYKDCYGDFGPIVQKTAARRDDDAIMADIERGLRHATIARKHSVPVSAVSRLAKKWGAS